MPTNKRVALIVAFAVTVVLCGLTAQAQSKYVSNFNGFEMSQGHKELSGEAYGWVCYGKTSGYLPGNLTLMMDYQAQSEVGLDTIARVSDIIGGGNNNKIITGGNWTLPVYTTTIRGTTTYVGVLYGTVTSGTFTWDDMGYTGTMNLKLQITGGTQTMVGWQGTVDFDATVNPGPAPIFNGSPPPMDGTLTFNFQ
ncbi:MAG: hypothetical protein QOH51_1520 [Acidobacteriota bacterium]|jgi:hypothetical protein|nr:hypothetical protein [Acidobacteriota bacterium]